MTPVTRRTLLQAGAGALGLASLHGQEKPAFRHRCYLGWITDLDPRAQPEVEWPSMRIDDVLLEEYSQTFALLHELGFQAVVIWGFYVSRNWPVDIKSAVTPERSVLIQKLIDSAHAHGLRVYTGLGVYSWGFEEILRAHPELSRGNSQAMCGSLPESWEWMRKVTDFALTRFPVDGVSLQSADQGRCDCEQCRRYTDTEYHARLDIRTAEYIRSRWPRMTVAVSGWGMSLDDPASAPALVDLSRRIDYLIDVPDSARKRDPSHRRELIEHLACSFGTLGGPQVEPPQHWARDRWFLPTSKAQARELASLHADGGSACEYFFHIRANPGDEVSLWVAGKQLADPAGSWPNHLTSTLERLYRTTKPATVNALAELFLRAEDAYLRNLPTFRSGTIAMEPLISSQAGPPVYLTKRLTPDARAAYRKEILAVRDGFRKLASDVPEKKRIETILRCLDNVRADLDSVLTASRPRARHITEPA